MYQLNHRGAVADDSRLVVVAGDRHRLPYRLLLTEPTVAKVRPPEHHEALRSLLVQPESPPGYQAPGAIVVLLPAPAEDSELAPVVVRVLEPPLAVEQRAQALKPVAELVPVAAQGQALSPVEVLAAVPVVVPRRVLAPEQQEATPPGPVVVLAVVPVWELAHSRQEPAE